MQKIVNCLWYDNQAEEAMALYTLLFKNSKTKDVSRYTAEVAERAGKKEGDVLVGTFELDGQEFMALNGGPMFKFNEAISLVINCETQEEVDYFWNGLIADGGEESMCGWLKDKFGLSWQVVPTAMNEMMTKGSPEQQRAVMAEMLKMRKLIIADMQKAYDNAA